MKDFQKRKTAIRAYIDYLANPQKTKTQGEFAKELGYKGVGPLNDFKETLGFWDKVWDRFENHYLQGELPEVNKALIEGAKKGDTDKMKMIYKLAKKIKEETEEHKGPEIKLIIEK